MLTPRHNLAVFAVESWQHMCDSRSKCPSEESRNAWKGRHQIPPANFICLDGAPGDAEQAPSARPTPVEPPSAESAQVARSQPIPQQPTPSQSAPANDSTKIAVPDSTLAGIAPIRLKGPTVADRLKRFDAKQDAAKAAPKLDGPRLPHRSTNLKRRMNPFIRRDASGDPSDTQPSSNSRDVSKETSPTHPPAYQESSSATRDTQEPILHGLDTSRGDKEAANIRSGFGRRTSKYFERVINPMPNSSPPIGQVMCPRHGRKLKPKARGGPELGGLDKDLKGAYIPSGRKIRHQVEATSPWYVLAKYLTKTEGTSLSPEPCADCLAEAEIIRKEQDAHVTELPDTENDLEVVNSRDERGSTITEPGTPIHEATPGPTIIGTAEEHQAVNIPGAGVTQAGSKEISTLVAADLGDMIDAIIIEHHGALDKVITNLRNGAPGQPEMDQLSKELADVSTSIRSADGRPCTVLDHNQRFSIILDTPPAFLRSRTKSVSDLVEFVESAAEDLGIKMPKKETKQPDGGGTASFHVSTSDTTERRSNATVAAGPQTLLAPPLGNTSLLVDIPTPFITPHDSPIGSPTLGRNEGSDHSAMTPLASTDISPSTVPSSTISAQANQLRAALTDMVPSSLQGPPLQSQTSMPTAMPTAMQCDANVQAPEAVKVANVPLASKPAVAEPSISDKSSSIARPASSPPATQESATQDPAPPTRIPSTKNLGGVTTVPRRYASTSVKTPAAPWSRDSKTEWAAVKPSLVKERQKQQESKLGAEAVKSASLKERTERRARFQGKDDSVGSQDKAA